MRKTIFSILLFASCSYGQVGISIFPEAEFLPVATLVNKSISQFQSCYKTYLNSGGKEYGDVILKWSIEPGGSVVKKAVVLDEIKNSQMNTCLFNQLNKVNFSSLGGGKHIKVDSFPFTFKRRHY